MGGETLDFVDICAPPGSHASLIGRALDAGLHVLCEKPLATRVEDAEIAAAAAARAGRVLHTVHNWLKAPICLKISALIDEGAIGAVRSVRWRTLRTQPATAASQDGVTNWRVDPALAGGGILFDHGWHALYCVARWAGVPRGVSARLETRRFHEWPLEDTATLALETAFGASRIFLTWAADERSNAIEIDGERGPDPCRRRCCRHEIEFAGAPLVVSPLPVRRIAPSRLVRRGDRRLSACGDRRRRQQPEGSGLMRPADRRGSAVKRRRRRLAAFRRLGARRWREGAPRGTQPGKNRSAPPPRPKAETSSTCR